MRLIFVPLIAPELIPTPLIVLVVVADMLPASVRLPEDVRLFVPLKKLTFPVFVSPSVNDCLLVVARVPVADRYVPPVDPERVAMGVFEATPSIANLADAVAFPPIPKSYVELEGLRKFEFNCQYCAIPVAPAHDVHVGELAPETKHRPVEDVVADVITPVPVVPKRMALFPVDDPNPMLPSAMLPVDKEPRLSVCMFVVPSTPPPVRNVALLPLFADIDAVGVPPATLMKANFALADDIPPNKTSYVELLGEMALVFNCHNSVPVWNPQLDEF